MTTGRASAARSAPGRKLVNTLDKGGLTFGIIEMLDSRDSNFMKKVWLSYGFKDVSPIWGERTSVPTFKSRKSIIDQWPVFQGEFSDLKADWYYLSGHHGRQFALDDKGMDFLAHAGIQKEVGFFNHWYHEGTWEHASQAEPTKGQRPLEVYMTTTAAAPGFPLGPQDHPLYTRVRDECRGVICISCNNLAYNACRKALVRFFPRAVIIGMVFKNSMDSMPLMRRLLSVCKKDFFLKPKDTPPAELVRKLNPGVRKPYHDMLGVISDRVFTFVSFGDKVQSITIS